MAGVPIRSYMDDVKINWRHGTKPNYDLINKKFMDEKRMNHEEGSLEKIVEDLVKTWEMESSHKMSAEDWQSIDKTTFTIRNNGGHTFNLDDNIRLGNYNMLMDQSPLYDPANETNQSSHDAFGQTFTSGFAWEVMEVHSGPPTVAFTWRHWGTMDGPYKGRPGTGEKLEMFGCCVVKVTDQLKIQSIDVYFDPNPMLMQLTGFTRSPQPTRSNGCPMSKK